MSIGILNEALLGVQQNQRRFQRAAHEVTVAASEGPDPDAPDLDDAALRLMTARRGLEACLAVARTGDEMLGTIIDVLA